MRLIDADALERMGYVLTRTYQQNKETMVYETKKLSDVPSVELDRKGKWICKYFPISIGSKVFVEVNICSNCGYVVEGNNVSHFCPVCGSDMGGKNDEGLD